MRRKTGQKQAAEDAKKTAQELIQKTRIGWWGATVRFRSADGRILTGEIRSVEHHVLGKRLRVLSGSVVMIVNVDQLV